MLVLYVVRLYGVIVVSFILLPSPHYHIAVAVGVAVAVVVASSRLTTLPQHLRRLYLCLPHHLTSASARTSALRLDCYLYPSAADVHIYHSAAGPTSCALGLEHQGRTSYLLDYYPYGLLTRGWVRLTLVCSSAGRAALTITN